MRSRGLVVVTLASVAGSLAFLWPLLVTPTSTLAHSEDAPLLFALLLPLLLGVVLAELSDGGMDAKRVAMLGVLAALGAVLRPLGAGTGGIELVFLPIILGGRVFGPSFGFVLGATTLFASALLTAGVGPWLPFQMLAASWVGMGAGLLPRRWRGGREVALLAMYGAVSALLFGFVMNMYFWPFIAGADTAVSMQPGAAVWDNLRRFAVYHLTTSLGWDVGRAITNVVVISFAGRGVLIALRRTARRASFAAAEATWSDDSAQNRAGSLSP
ncbi:MAG: ECF transporter S component [Acidimicrobiia bacterium]|nr:ECF transporter S component [Acidimicrobiia bacterium]